MCVCRPTHNIIDSEQNFNVCTFIFLYSNDLIRRIRNVTALLSSMTYRSHTW